MVSRQKSRKSMPLSQSSDLMSRLASSRPVLGAAAFVALLQNACGPVVGMSTVMEPEGSEIQANEFGREATESAAMVRPDGYFSEFYNCSNRGGCAVANLVIKVLVKPVVGGDLNKKRVGVSWQKPLGSYGDGGFQTAYGSFFSTRNVDGENMEEWHVPVNLHQAYSSNVTYSVWYDTGVENQSFYNNNGGAYHAAGLHVLYMDYLTTSSEGPRVTSAGIRGIVRIQVANLAYDKDIVLLYSTDKWKTVRELKMGQGEVNAWRWVSNEWGYDKFEIELDMPDVVEEMEYAVVYRHAAGRQVHEFWLNNDGQNYRALKGN